MYFNFISNWCIWSYKAPRPGLASIPEVPPVSSKIVFFYFQIGNSNTTKKGFSYFRGIFFRDIENSKNAISLETRKRGLSILNQEVSQIITLNSNKRTTWKKYARDFRIIWKISEIKGLKIGLKWWSPWENFRPYFLLLTICLIFIMINKIRLHFPIICYLKIVESSFFLFSV